MNTTQLKLLDARKLFEAGAIASLEAAPHYITSSSWVLHVNGKNKQQWVIVNSNKQRGLDDKLDFVIKEYRSLDAIAADVKSIGGQLKSIKFS